MDLINTPAFWVNEAGIAFYESGAQNELDVDQATWEAEWLAKHNRDAEGNLEPDDSVVHWTKLAADEDRRAESIESGWIPGTTLEARAHRREAERYRLVAESIRLGRETEKPHCGCTNPPHPL